MYIYILYYFFNYGITISDFPYDWEPTDGDHMNIVSRILKNLPIYSDWKTGIIVNLYPPVLLYATMVYLNMNFVLLVHMPGHLSLLMINLIEIQ